MRNVLVSPAAGAALLAARSAAQTDAEMRARNYWLVVSDARAAFRAGRAKAGVAGLTAIRFRLARAVALRERNWTCRLKAAEADLEARAMRASAPEIAA